MMSVWTEKCPTRHEESDVEPVKHFQYGAQSEFQWTKILLSEGWCEQFIYVDGEVLVNGDDAAGCQQNTKEKPA